MGIEVFPLGSGQEVGRSCIIVTILDKTIMLDCGLHMTHSDQRRFPDFSLIKQKVDLVLVTHFHLDHCGALPYFTEIFGYHGAVVMSMPSKALLPYMLEDYRRIWTNPQTHAQKEDSIADPLLVYNSDQIKACVNKVKIISLNETQVHSGIEVTAYYAGHLLGACMFSIRYRDHSFVYTGDFNSLSDRHLGAAYIDRLQPDLLISESTYATVIRDSKRIRERNFLMHVQEVLDKGGKVLIPVFALGRAQELSVLLESYWTRTKCKHGLYFAAGLIEKANQYYKIFSNWESEKIQDSFLDENIFNFKYILPFDRSLIKSNAPMVLLATPGMLHGGLSMQVFKEWCGNEKNSLVIPGYCVAGTLGNKLLSGVKSVRIDNKDYEVKMSVMNMSFSAHADTRGILQMVNHLAPKELMFVHGEAIRMKTLAKEIIDSMSIPSHCPANFELLQINKIMPIERQLKIVGQSGFTQGYFLEYQNNKIFIQEESQIIEEIKILLAQISQGQAPNFQPFKIRKYLITSGKGDFVYGGLNCIEYKK